jgi:hypothetical protein
MADFEVQDEGTIVLLKPVSDEAKEWGESHIDQEAERWGVAYVIEPRYLADIIEGIVNHGLTVESV